MPPTAMMESSECAANTNIDLILFVLIKNYFKLPPFFCDLTDYFDNCLISAIVSSQHPGSPPKISVFFITKFLRICASRSLITRPSRTLAVLSLPDFKRKSNLTAFAYCNPTLRHFANQWISSLSEIPAAWRAYFNAKAVARLRSVHSYSLIIREQASSFLSAITVFVIDHQT